ncbi:bacterioferritin-associated ferredoxin [Alteromonas sp. a30]|uniref:bacterioferritin-associated ferredoxin n=1 Tax=Alteromonas sp. a30 TaxID=2730917 RepID=UPI002280EA30|nr:bacterioferritin-associated ferredoxin [Alteromonas sp. a30]MCY7296846.1 bacterioferritin-associated ferredoxin [Alteromonas sp. a30]
MYVCLCNAITDKTIREAVEDGAGNIRELKQQLGVASQCGKCTQVAQQIIDQTIVDCSLFKEVS